jgi:succinyl-diaminopimelate desuccinylase
VSDLLASTAELVAIPSVSHDESAIADLLHDRLAAVPGLAVERIEDNVVARTQRGRPARLVLAGHTDTVPPNGNAEPRIDGDRLWGLGSADMKGGLAVMLELAATAGAPALDVTYVFYVCEEVERSYNGLSHLWAVRPDLIAGDAAVLLEPTGGRVEAGCQGTLRLSASLAGRRAHTARPWMGVNAIHRLGRLLALVEGYEGRRPVIDTCEYREALQAVAVHGGVAANVVPDQASVVLNHRFAPDRTVDEAERSLLELLGPALDDAGDEVTRVDWAPPAAPALAHPLLASLVAASGAAPRAKLGWTDVAFFAERGVPATNFGPGDPSVAHTADEAVERSEIEAVHRILAGVLAGDG